MEKERLFKLMRASLESRNIIEDIMLKGNGYLEGSRSIVVNAF